MNYNEMLRADLEGIYSDYLEKVNDINTWYDLYEGRQEWITNEGLDYTPTKKITNIMRTLIDKRARFMFGREPYFDIRAEKDLGNEDEAAEKEDLLEGILTANKFHSKLLKAKKDCSIGGRVAIKLWADKDAGLKVIFSPAQEFFTQYNLDNIDELEKVIFLYSINNETESEHQRVKKQTWEMVGNTCIMNESTHNGNGDTISIEYDEWNTSLDFIPVIIIQNGGLTGDTEGYSDIEMMWGNQDAYNKLTSDDLDALKFNMFPQTVATDAAEESLAGMMIAPGALIDMQTHMAQGASGRQASMKILESGFSYGDKYEQTIDRIKADMYEAMSVPNVGMAQLQGVISSGKAMKTLYWDLMSAVSEEMTEWVPSLEQMADYIFRMVDIYNLYGARKIAKYNTALVIETYFPIEDDIVENKRVAMEEVIAEVRSKTSYMKQFGEYEDEEEELKQIALEQLLLQDSYNMELDFDVNEPTDAELEAQIES